jgi:hypothetical protein
MAVLVLLYRSKTWTLRKRNGNRTQAAEMKHVRTVKGCAMTDQLKMIYERSWASSLYMKKAQNIQTNGKFICEEWNMLAFQFTPINTVHLV